MAGFTLLRLFGFPGIAAERAAGQPAAAAAAIAFREEAVAAGVASAALDARKSHVKSSRVDQVVFAPL